MRLEPVERVVLARRVVLPELDLRAEDRRLGGHAVLHPPAGHEDDLGELLVDLEIGVEPHLGIQVVVHVLDADIARYPRAVDDQRHRDLVQLLAAYRALEGVPLSRQHA
jgi:hypothetical protein